jgi:hypothetical protein
MVEPLVTGLPQASYQHFPSYDEALNDYLTARGKGWVRVERLSTDDGIFGQVEYAEDL